MVTTRRPFTYPLDNFAYVSGSQSLRLRSLDAIHLVAARRAGDALRAVVTYDARMLVSCRGSRTDSASQR